MQNHRSKYPSYVSDDVGNRHLRRHTHIPADDIGNRLESLEESDIIPDDLGNRFFGMRSRPFVQEPIATPKAKEIETEKEEETQVFILKSDPEDKRLLAHKTASSMLAKLEPAPEITTELITQHDQPSVLVRIREKNKNSCVIRAHSPALMAMVYLMNKIVNRYPDDRIRLQVLIEKPAGESQKEVIL